jgi:LPLT family lysophospholipid transporter-like MFS transporter
MPFGFYIIMAAQFFSALADNALLIVAISVLREMHAPSEYEPLLKTFFTVSYVALAAFVGAFADSMPKWRVMFISNGIKIIGCAMMFWQVHPLLAYAVVGLGAAAYSPAKYGILTEYLPHRLLVVANGWIEGLTVGAIILGVVVGGMLIQPEVARSLLAFDFPLIDTGVDTTARCRSASSPPFTCSQRCSTYMFPIPASITGCCTRTPGICCANSIIA